MKYALIIGNNKYDDPKLAQLKTPAADSQALAKVLDDKTIGAFDAVTPLINQNETRVRRAISEFLTDKKPDDLVMLYFSGHGILDDRGRLYLALKDTQVNLLKATSLPSSFLTDEMDSCRSKRQILILDCCHSGAFARGVKGEQKAVTEATFEGSGFGRVVLTASDSTQYALEGDQVLKQTEFSLFTHFLLDGLRTGQADINNDGQISLDEWYDYTYGRVISETPMQVPHKWSYNQQGDLVIARNPFLQKKVSELPYELVQASESSFVGIRESAVNELGKYLRSRDADMVALAVAALRRMKEDDSRRISSLAEKLLAEFEQSREPRQETPHLQAEVVKEDTPVMEAPSIPEKQILPARTQTMSSASAPAAAEDAFDSRFWLQWIGTAVLGIVLGIPIFYYHTTIDQSLPNLALLFGSATAVTALAQWYLFRNILEFWWVPVNAAIGLGFAGLHISLYNNIGWGYEDVRKLLIFWSVINFVTGIVLLRSGPAGTAVSIFPQTGKARNLFLLLLSISLLASNLASIVYVWQGYDLAKYLWVPYGIVAIVAGISFWQSRTPRNFGWITLVLFLLIDGANTALLGLNGEYPLYYFVLGGILAWAAAVYFAFHRETWKNVVYVLLTGYLIAVGLADVAVYDTSASPALLKIAVAFGILAAVLLLLQQQRAVMKQNSEV
ncbi:MAG TPA: caspase family protein [Anaerolineales bacterium]|nr:caspase family protein [Anaerolineales bacterium]